MRFVFIWPAPGVLGGIETLIARMSRWLTEHGHEVSVLVESGDNWAHTLSNKVRCVVLGKRFGELNYYFHCRRLWQSLGIGQPDVIKSFDLVSSWIASQLARQAGPQCKVLAGLYGAYFFKWYYNYETLGLWNADRIYLDNYLNCIPPNARVVCSIDQVEDLEEVYQQKCLLWPAPIDTGVFDPARRAAKWGKIVSVGRMDVMKGYNLYMVDVVKELRRKGHDVHWSVYGTGDQEPAVRERIAKEGLEGVISLEGTVPYRRFWQVLSDAYVFVGMGTSILEAALFGVPNVVALAYDGEGLTYGPSYTAPKGSMGPSLISRPSLRVADQVERVLRLGPAEYEAEERRVQDHVRPHQMDLSMGRFLELAAEAEPLKHRMSRYLRNYPRRVIDGVVRKVHPQPPRGHPNRLLYGGAKANVQPG